MNRGIIALAFAGGVIIAAASWLLWPQSEPERSAAALMDVVMWNKEPIGGSFTLIDQDGRSRSDAEFRGKLLLIYFGYTYCTDVCPTDMQSISSAVDWLGPAGEGVQPLFITVDPEHDRPEQLKLYVALYHPRLIGLTGSSGAIKRVARAYKVYYAKSDPARQADRTIDHSSFIFLIGREGQYLGFFPPGTPPDRLVEVIRSYLATTQH